MRLKWDIDKRIKMGIAGIVITFVFCGCSRNINVPESVELYPKEDDQFQIDIAQDKTIQSHSISENARLSEDDNIVISDDVITDESNEKEIECVDVCISEEMTYAEYSAVFSGVAKLYKNPNEKRGKYVVCVNAGHGSRKAAQVKTQCHPDGSPKVTGGSTQAGAIMAIAASSGMTFIDGTPEGTVTLRQALILKDTLLIAGYSVLMIRETDDVDLDNIARTVLANEYACCHIAIHWDSTENDKGAFYCSVPDISSYRNMEPVASTWRMSMAFGDCIIDGLRKEGVKIYSTGKIPIDLTQTSYSTIPSIDIELGDKGSDYSEGELIKNAEGILRGVDMYFEIID